MDYNKLADLLYPNITKTPADYDEIYPPRELPQGAKVVRFAPSPTGYMHIGNLFSALIDKLAADSSNGIFYLRIEDTDKKREVDDAIDHIISGLSSYGIIPQEGIMSQIDEIGNYGPYKQSLRCEIYHTFAKELIQKGYAYPCFCSEDDLAANVEQQEKEGVQTGYYGKWAKCRDLTFEEIEEHINNGDSFVIRLKSQGDENKKIIVNDEIKGKLEMPENTQDAVLIKSDGIPPYAFAHAVDDHLMRTTHVVRGDEWVSSLPTHIQIHQYLGLKAPKYAHISPIMKLDDGNKRKLSKRKDPEAAVAYYEEVGYPEGGVLEYLMGIANSNFEDWRRANPDADLRSFPFSFKKMSASGALFDLLKLNDVCKNVISKMSAEEVYDYAIGWAEKYDKELYALLGSDSDFAVEIFKIDRYNKKPRKDIYAWSQVKDYVSYFYNEIFDKNITFPEDFAKEDINAILEAYAKVYDENHDKDQWFETMKSICEPLGYTPNVKEYKADPDKFKGHVGDVSTVIRVAVTNRTNTPDLYSILKLLGKDEVLARLSVRV